MRPISIGLDVLFEALPPNLKYLVYRPKLIADTKLSGAPARTLKATCHPQGSVTFYESFIWLRESTLM
jgi:hypothetical protein